MLWLENAFPEKIAALLRKYRPYYRYTLVSLGAYVYVFALMFVFVDLLHLHKTVAYFLTYASAYCLDYFLTLRYVFDETHHWRKVIKYIIHVVCFLSLGTLLFDTLTRWGLHYLLATLATIVLLFPFRIMGYRLVVR